MSYYTLYKVELTESAMYLSFTDNKNIPLNDINISLYNKIGLKKFLVKNNVIIADLVDIFFNGKKIGEYKK